MPSKAQTQDQAPLPSSEGNPARTYMWTRTLSQRNWSLVPSGSCQIMPVFEDRNLPDSIFVSRVGSQHQAQSRTPQITELSAPLPHSLPTCSPGAGPGVGLGLSSSWAATCFSFVPCSPGTAHGHPVPRGEDHVRATDLAAPHYPQRHHSW